jgi:hypothetical protein
LPVNSFGETFNAIQIAIDVHSDLAANSFGGSAYSTQYAIDIASDLAASTFGGAANATQHAIDAFLIELQIHLVELLMQFKLQLMRILI